MLNQHSCSSAINLVATALCRLVVTGSQQIVEQVVCTCVKSTIVNTLSTDCSTGCNPIMYNYVQLTPHAGLLLSSCDNHLAKYLDKLSKVGSNIMPVRYHMHPSLSR